MIGARATGDPEQVAPQSKLTPELAAKIIEAVRVGNRIDVAARANGVSADTLFTWLRKGREATRGGYFELAVGIDQAIADSEVRDLNTIDRASEEQWQAAAWKLERRFPDAYGRRTRHEGQIDLRATPWLDYSKLDPADMEDLHRILEKGNPGADEVPSGGRPALELLEGGTR